MNFIKATLADGGTTLKTATFSLPVAQAYRALTAGKDGKALIVGIRAENLSDGSRPVRGESARIPRPSRSPSRSATKSSSTPGSAPTT